MVFTKAIWCFVCLNALLFCVGVRVGVGSTHAVATAPAELHGQLQQAIVEAGKTGEKTEAWLNERQQLLDEIQSLELKKAWAEFQLAKTERWLEAEVENTALLEENLAKAAATREQLEPFLEVLYETLEHHVQKDMPFNQEERSRRLAFIRSTLDDPTKGLSDKLGRIFEAMQVEVDYGYTVEAGEELAELGQNQFSQATLFRLGRLSLFRIFGGQGRLERFDGRSGEWVEVSARYIPEVEKAIDIARKKRVTTLLNLPVGTMAQLTEEPTTGDSSQEESLR